ncbi:MAG: C10 family peptidase [Bacteroidales bacterium]|nr:C10 family peptidase [Bacteroidales bacterium]
MRRLLFLIALSAGVLPLLAGQRSDDEMKRIAISKLNTTNQVKSLTGGVLTLRQVAPVQSTDTYTIYTPTEGSGFVVVSRSEDYPAVLAYSEGVFNTEEMPCGVEWWLNSIHHAMSSYKASTRAVTRAGGYTPVTPFLTTKWQQADPFNRKTPVVNGANTPVGCVATAMAQAMNYCKWPASANFTSTYYVGSKGEAHEATVNSKYYWPYQDAYGYYFPDGYTDRSQIQEAETGRKANLVAQLCVDCGYAAGMSYDTDGSGAYTFVAAPALITCFGYPEECIKYAERACYTDEAWMDLICNELQQKCPIVYSGSDEKSGGHAFVLHGMDADGLVYVNWGWRGEDDGYYDISLLNPTGMEFSSQQDMIYGIRTTPLSTDKPEPRLYSYGSTPYTFSIDTEKDDNGKNRVTLHVKFEYGLVNFSSTTFDGVVGLFGSDLTANTNWEIGEPDSIVFNPVEGYFLEQPAELFYYYIDDALVAGHTYRISFGGRDTKEGEWHGILCEGGEIGYDIKYTGNAATTTISEVKEALQVGIRETRKSSVVDDGLTRVYDTAGRLVYTTPSTGFNLWEVPARGVLVIKQGEKVKKVVR